MTTLAAYIDGFNLYYGMKNKYGRKHMWLDVIELVRQLRPKDDVKRVRYFSAIVKGEPAAAQNQLDYIEALKTRNGVLLDVHLGRFKDRTIRDCRRCGQPYTCRCGRTFTSFEEKGTDVALGAMMVADAALGVADTTLLISADTDLIPALVAVRHVSPQQRIYLAMPPGNTRASRYQAAIGGLVAFPIAETALRRAQLPAIVAHSTTGRSYTRPAKWS
ncbi:NYN domain-containing protein [Micromonospora inyonensis]|uniref:NYN domain-containing protein n=1 Tax=Micromonospora inyonensis TaxID=47866 RepID=UPI00159F0BDC|nr:NYN domain-containing protein [Micromonospora inyonensis]